MFEVTAVSLTPLDRIIVGHDNSGAGPGWKLAKIVVECPSAGLSQTFLCNSWLAQNEGRWLDNIQYILQTQSPSNHPTISQYQLQATG